MAITFDPQYGVIDRASKSISFSCTRTDSTSGIVDSVSGNAQITPTFTKANIWEHIGNLFDKKDSNASNDAALIVAFETNTKDYLETRFNV